MESYRESYRLYRQLLASGGTALLQYVVRPHHAQFMVDRKSGEYYKLLYIEQVEAQTENVFIPPPNDETCNGCKSHFLGQRPEINHKNDLEFGSILESFFMNFLNSEFLNRKWPLQCERADDARLNMPDFTIKNLNTGESVFYFEFKCIFRPFIMVHREISNAFCYSHSMTLDCNSKLEKQKKLVVENGLESKTAYLYWYDIPCIKGIFWQFSSFVYSYDLRAEKYTRKHQKGDYRAGLKTGNVDKIYLPLHKMNHFQQLFLHLESTL